MSAAAVIAFDPPGAAGWFKVRRGDPERNIPPDERAWNYKRLIARFGGDGYAIWSMYWDAASFPGAGEYVRLDEAEALGIFKKTAQWLWGQIRRLVHGRVLIGDPARAGYYRPAPENIDAASCVVNRVRPGRGRPRKPMGQAIEAAAGPEAKMYFQAAPEPDPPPGELPEPEPAPDRVECPTCGGRGYLEQPVEAEMQFPPYENTFSSARKYNSALAPLSHTIRALSRAPKNLEESREEEKQARPCLLDPTEEQLSRWAAYQPYGGTRRTGLSPEEMRPVVERIHAAGYRVDCFVTFLRDQKVTLSPDRENVTGLLIRLVEKFAAFARYRSPNRANDPSGGPPG